MEVLKDMAKTRHIYGEIDNKSDLEKVFREIRDDVENARSRETLTELYRRAGYLITLTHAPSWHEKFGARAEDLRDEAEQEFATTARKINRQAEKIGTEADYDEKWGS